jgi:hypothetical protein
MRYFFYQWFVAHRLWTLYILTLGLMLGLLGATAAYGAAPLEENVTDVALASPAAG